LYIPGDRKSIAIENLSSAPDSFNNRMGLVTLDPGEEKAFTLHYTIKTEETV
jgi:aldose 1-epimerase